MKRLTVKSSRRFKAVYKRGRSFVSGELVTYVLKNGINKNRYGITAAKKIGNAVMRNRARRIIRAAYFEIYNDPNLKKGYDFIFIARSKTPYLKSTDIYPKMYEHLIKAGAIKENV
ncbi:MAG: ribonuclease P protein component [Clostridiales bacterium]|nr:ribonuclease P protein component [Clostridiales bacterium]